MKIITDTGADLPPVWLQENSVPVISLHIAWHNGESADEISRPAFYDRLSKELHPPKTSQPAVGEFQRLYERESSQDPDILSVHISSGMSGTVQAARAAANLVPAARVTVIDTLTLSGAQGWQVRTAVAAAQEGDDLKTILDKVARVRQATETVYTLNTLHYLMLGGRIGRVRGTVGSLLRIKPLIAVDKQTGTYVQVGTGRSLKTAMRALVSYVAQCANTEAGIIAQVMHAEAQELADELQELITHHFHTRLLPMGQISPVLGVHTGPGLVGLCFAPSALLKGITLR